jgi:hypothetical protein
MDTGFKSCAGTDLKSEFPTANTRAKTSYKYIYKHLVVKVQPNTLLTHLFRWKIFQDLL